MKRYLCYPWNQHARVAPFLWGTVETGLFAIYVIVVGLKGVLLPRLAVEPLPVRTGRSTGGRVTDQLMVMVLGVVTVVVLIHLVSKAALGFGRVCLLVV